MNDVRCGNGLVRYSGLRDTYRSGTDSGLFLGRATVSVCMVPTLPPPCEGLQRGQRAKVGNRLARNVQGEGVELQSSEMDVDRVAEAVPVAKPANLSLRFEVRIEVGDGTKLPTPDTSAAVNKLPGEVKDGYEIR